MKLPQTGGCQCGMLRYEITQAPHLMTLLSPGGSG